MGLLDFLIKTRSTADSDVIASRGDNGAESGPTDLNSGKITSEKNQKLTDQNIYPSDLFTPGVEPYILFFVRDGVAKTRGIKDKVALYMPRSLVVNYGAQYQEIEMTVLQYADLLTDVTSQNTDGGRKNDMKEMTALAQRAGANAIDWESGGTFGQQLEVLQRDMTVNPHMALLFKGVDFRTFTFKFQMMARNAKESAAIKKIIKIFKVAMHPSKSTEKGARYWKYPDNFDILLFTPGTNCLFNMSTCVLSNMTVDYAGSEIPSFFTPSGDPVDIRMTLTFRELEILTRERIEDGGY